METRRLVTALLASIAVFYLWILAYQQFFYNPPEQPTGEETEQVAEDSTATEQARATQPSAATQTAAGTAPAEFSTPTPQQASAPASMPETMRVGAGDTLQMLHMGDAEAGSVYPMGIGLSTLGGTVTDVYVRGHYDTVKKERPYPIIEPVALENGHLEVEEYYSFVTTRVNIENKGLKYELGDVLWRVEENVPGKTVFSVDLKDAADQVLARLIKTYTLAKQPPKEGTFDLELSLRVDNLSGEPLKVIITQQGPIGFRKEQLRGEDRKVIAAIWKEGGVAPIINSFARSNVMKQGLIPLGSDTDNERIAWISESNQYFACIMAPRGRDGFVKDKVFNRAEAIHLSEIEEQSDAPQDRQDLSFRYVTRPLTVAAGGTTDVAFDCFIGPKSKQSFEEVARYSQRNYEETIEEYFYFCAPDALVRFMMGLLNMFYKIPPHNYGLAIIVLVLVVRGVLHPVTKKSQVNMMKMQKQMSTLQPKIEAAKQKYANDKNALNQAIMEIYKEQGVNPAGQMLSCMPMMLQIPIWAALWAALNTSIDMRHAPFDGWWIRDLSGQDALITFSQPIHIPLIGMLMSGPVTSLNLLPILLGVSQLLQARFMPRGNPQQADPTGNTNQLDQQRKMMMFMSLFFVFILYNAPSGLNLYIMSSNLFGILEQIRIRKHLQEMEEKGAMTPKEKKGPRKKSWLERKWEEAQKMADEAKKVESGREKKKSSSSRRR